MQYRGVNFTIVQTIEPGWWKWTIETPPEKRRRRQGETNSREAALIEVKKAIDRALVPKKVRLGMFGH